MQLASFNHYKHSFIYTNTDYSVHDAFPLLPLLPFHLLGTLLAVTGSVHPGLRLLVNWTPQFPPLLIYPQFQIPDPLRFLPSKYTFIRMASRTWLTRSSTLQIVQPTFVSFFFSQYLCWQVREGWTVQNCLKELEVGENWHVSFLISQMMLCRYVKALWLVRWCFLPICEALWMVRWSSSPHRIALWWWVVAIGLNIIALWLVN
jgi:hypothetical protein